MANNEPKDVLIFGSGIIGLCSAYYLLTSPTLARKSTVTILENSRSGVVAPGASSYAGGFLAGGNGGWHNPSSDPLARLSWKCHVELSNELGGAERWGFRECKAVGLSVGRSEDVSRSAYRNLPSGRRDGKQEGDWLNGEREDIAGQGGTGQVDPELLCKALHEECTSLGLVTLFADAVSLSAPSRERAERRTLSFKSHDSPHELVSRTYTDVVMAAGPWSANLCETLVLPSVPISNLPGHSLLVRPSATELPPEAVFAGISGSAFGVHASTSRNATENKQSSGFTQSPELFPRPNGLVYVAGENSIPGTPSLIDRSVISLPNRLPHNVDDVKKLLDRNLAQRLERAAAAVSLKLDTLNGAIIEKEQLCYRPITPDGEPIIDRLTDGVWVASGHGPWVGELEVLQLTAQKRFILTADEDIALF